MTYSLFTCEAQNAVVLVCDQPLYALGPVLVADDVEEAFGAMTAFCDALGAAPDEVPTIALMTEWQAFLAAVTGHVIAPLGAVSENAGGEGGHLDEETLAESVQEPEAAPGGAEDYPAAESGAESEPSSATPREPSSANAPPDSAESGPGSPDALAGSTGPIGAPDDPEDDDADEDEDPDLAARIAEAPHTPVKDGYAECWACGGAGKVKIGEDEHDCAACRGSGRTTAPAQTGA